MRLPDAIIVGAPRSGTTTLFAALRGSSEVFAAAGKELHFFDNHWDLGLNWYSEHFSRAPISQVAIEATPMYLSNSAAMRRMSSACAQAVLIAILRNPVERMHSHFYYRRARGLDRGTIQDAVAREIGGEDDAFPYLGIGLYHQQLTHAQSLGFEHPICVLWYDDLANDPRALSARLAGQLGIAAGSLDFRAHHVNSADRFRSIRLRQASRRWPRPVRGAIARINRHELSYPPLDEATRRRALEFLQEDVNRLGRLTGRSLGSWLE